jgi:N-acetyl sugar amidotransferase
MDNTDPDITFDENGVCNHCNEAFSKIPTYKFTSLQEKENIENLKLRIKKRQKSNYDSIIGLSGGVDSSYVAYMAHKMGLNPLCVHFDNGWNSSTAVKNIRNIIDITGFDLHTHVIDWPEFRDLQRSFFKSGVIDIEMLTDHAISATILNLQKKYRISTILSGTNYITEHGMPNKWVWTKIDFHHIQAIHKRFGIIKLKSYPSIRVLNWMMMRRFNFKGVNYEQPLNYINFSKMHAIEKLKSTFDWEYYGGKHHESVFTKFYQGYILPNKFNVDKRKPHLSALIRNGEITRTAALMELREEPIYSDNELMIDKKFVLKKLGFSDLEFDDYMQSKPVPHNYYPNNKKYVELIVRLGEYVFGKKQ